MNNINSLNPTILIITDNFNKKYLKWYYFDASDNIGKESDTFASIAGYGQIIDKSTHFTNSCSSCIYLNFTSNSSTIVDSGIEKTLSSSCHHDIMYGKIKFRVLLPPSHFRAIWGYKNSDASSVQHALEKFNWQYTFESKIIG